MSSLEMAANPEWLQQYIITNSRAVNWLPVTGVVFDSPSSSLSSEPLLPSQSHSPGLDCLDIPPNDDIYRLTPVLFDARESVHLPVSSTSIYTELSNLRLDSPAPSLAPSAFSATPSPSPALVPCSEPINCAPQPTPLSTPARHVSSSAPLIPDRLPVSPSAENIDPSATMNKKPLVAAVSCARGKRPLRVAAQALPRLPTTLLTESDLKAPLLTGLATPAAAPLSALRTSMLQIKPRKNPHLLAKKTPDPRTNMPLVRVLSTLSSAKEVFKKDEDAVRTATTRKVLPAKEEPATRPILRAQKRAVKEKSLSPAKKAKLAGENCDAKKRKQSAPPVKQITAVKETKMKPEASRAKKELAAQVETVVMPVKRGRGRPRKSVQAAPTNEVSKTAASGMSTRSKATRFEFQGIPLKDVLKLFDHIHLRRALWQPLSDGDSESSELERIAELFHWKYSEQELRLVWLNRDECHSLMSAAGNEDDWIARKYRNLQPFLERTRLSVRNTFRALLHSNPELFTEQHDFELPEYILSNSQ